MTHTFKYLIKIALVASALSMTHSPSFAQEEPTASPIDYADKLKPYCQDTKDLVAAANQQQLTKTNMEGYVTSLTRPATTSSAFVSGGTVLRSSNHSLWNVYVHSEGLDGELHPNVLDLSHMTQTMQAVTDACTSAGY